ncbi:MAG: DEAD/DEAH box helicase [Bacteroidota bacterium]
MQKPTKFHKYGLHDRILLQLPELGFTAPTPVQEKVIPLFLQGKNLIVEAPTGTGKTAAYGFSLISRLNLSKNTTQALVLAPSRELVHQVGNALASYFQGDGLQVAKVYGGVPMGESFRAIKSGAQILVAVPGRLKDVMAHYKYDFLWKDIKFLIIDEGDKLMESGFQKDFDDLRTHIRNTAQVGFFSATISRDIELVMRERYPRIKTLRLSPKQMLRNIKFGYVQVPQGNREQVLAALLQQYRIKQALLFSGKRDEILSLVSFLRNYGYKAEAYFGNQSQEERTHILSRFKEGYINFLVASDLAARGLDIEALPTVINVTIPREYDFYLHRVGRTGRAGNSGKVYSLITSELDAVWLKQHHKKIDLPVRAIEIHSSQTFLPKTQQKWVKVHISRGKQDKIRKGDVLGFLIHTGGLPSEEIGTIMVFDTYSIADIPQEYLATLEKPPETLKIKGKTVKIRKYQQQEQQKKAQAIKKLKRDRR